MNKPTIILGGIAAIVVLILASAVFIGAVQETRQQLGFGHIGATTASSTSFSLTAAGTAADNVRILGTNTGRIGGQIVNHCSSAVYLFEATTTAHIPNRTKNENVRDGILLAASGGRYEINQNYLFQGAITASTTAACDIYVSEW